MGIATLHPSYGNVIQSPSAALGINSARNQNFSAYGLQGKLLVDCAGDLWFADN